MTPNLTLLIWELQFERELPKVMKTQESQGHAFQIDENKSCTLIQINFLEFLVFNYVCQLTSKSELPDEKGQIWGQPRNHILFLKNSNSNDKIQVNVAATSQFTHLLLNVNGTTFLGGLFKPALQFN